MATSVGHLLIGGAVGAAVPVEAGMRRRLSAGALAAVVPDLDVLPGALLGDPARFHHAQSHSLAFVALVTVAVAVMARGGRWRWTALIGLAYLSHLVLDYFTYDEAPPQGIPLFWPVYDAAIQSPVALLPNVAHASDVILSTHNILLVVREVLILGVVLLLTLALEWRRHDQEIPEALTEVVGGSGR